MTLAEKFVQSGFAKFMNTPSGRVTRVVAGLAFLIWGYTLFGQAEGIVLLVVGIVVFAAGAFDFCLISFVLGGPLSGKKIRADYPKT